MVLRVRDPILEEGQKLRRIVRQGQNAIEFHELSVKLSTLDGTVLG